MTAERMPVQLRDALQDRGITPHGWMLWGRLGECDLHGAEVDGRWIDGPFRSVTALVGPVRYIALWHE